MSSGQLQIRAGFDGRQIADLQVSLERPPVTRLFPGMSPAQLLHTVPLLYSLCSQAQARAAAAALAAAQGESLPDTDDRPLWLEALHEHLWRLLLDWPAALGLQDMQGPRADFAIWRKSRQAGAADFQSATSQLLQRTLGLAPDGSGTALAGSLAARCLERLKQTPLPPAAETLEALDAQTWLNHWRNANANPPLPPIASPATPGVAYARRLAAVATAWQALQQGSRYPVAGLGQDKRGVGLSQTARGLLVHGLQLSEDGSKIAAYQVWAPTDRYFADSTALQGLLAECSFNDASQARQALEQAILALDPCVPHAIAWMEN